MSETYTTGANEWQLLGSGVFAGQTFIPKETHVLHFIDLKLYLTGYFSIPSVEIFIVDANFKPFGSCLSRDRFSYWQVTGYSGPTFLRFNMQRVTLHQGTPYAIIVKNDPPLPATPSAWKYDKDDSQYSRGHRILSTDSGTNWTVYYDQDHFFTEFGDPPLPKPEPPPPIQHFAIPDITQPPCPAGVLIALATSVPCHLTLYWTDKKPLKHPRSRVVRGLTVPWATYFCFVAWQALEQIEPGDTLYHTFYFPDWLICQTRWFTLRGTVDNILSPSVGPIFEKHYTGPTPGSLTLRPNGRGDMQNIDDPKGAPGIDMWDNVNDIIPDEDQTYGHAGLIPDIGFYTDLYTMEPLPFTSGPLNKITLTARCKGWGFYPFAGRVKLGFKISGTRYESPIQWVDTYAWQNFTYTWNINPHTGLPWQAADLIDLQIGISLMGDYRSGYKSDTYCTQLYLDTDWG